MDTKKLLKPILLILAIIFFSSVLVRIFSGSETLLQYAEKNPEAARPKTEASGKEPASSGKAVDGSGQAKRSTGQDTAHKNTNENSYAAAASRESPAKGDKNYDGYTGEAAANSENSKNRESGETEMTENPDRVEYQRGFYYEPLSEDMKKRITGISYPVTEEEAKKRGQNGMVNVVPSAEDIEIDYDDLRYVSVMHYNFKGIEKTGELICNQAIAQDLVEIFYELYQNQYQIEQIHLIDEYSGDDTLSMQDNNTSCFNYRVVDGTTHLSKHALGLAVDINPFFNPYVEYQNDGTTYISPQGGEAYADRSREFAWKIDEDDLCYKLFKERGFIWGGNWNSCKDYQHFQKSVG